MQPYVIRKGDYLLKLAYTFGFDADAVWNHEKNADLRRRRSDPNTLLPCDILYIPDPPKPRWFEVAAGSTRTFVVDVPSARLAVRFSEPHLASQPCRVRELQELGELHTDGDGVLQFQVPVTLAAATIEFTNIHFSCRCAIGHLDPVDTPTGVFQRLQNLGHIDSTLTFREGSIGLARGGLRALRAAPGVEAPRTSKDGLADNQVPDHETSSLLLATHGC